MGLQHPWPSRIERLGRCCSTIGGGGPEESWRECHLHARNLLGEEGYRELLDDIAMGKRADSPASTAASSAVPSGASAQESLFE